MKVHSNFTYNMLSLLFVILGAVAINGQTHIDNLECEATAIKTFDWTKFAANSWYQMYTSDNSYNSTQCVAFHFQLVKDLDYEIHMSGFENNEIQQHTLKIEITDTIGSFKYEDKIHNIVVWQDKKFAIVHECTATESVTDKPPVGPSSYAETPKYITTKTWILTNDLAISLKDLENLIKQASISKVDVETVIDDLKPTRHDAKTCSGSAVTQAIAFLLVACAALTRLI